MSEKTVLATQVAVYSTALVDSADSVLRRHLIQLLATTYSSLHPLTIASMTHSLFRLSQLGQCFGHSSGSSSLVPLSSAMSVLVNRSQCRCQRQCGAITRIVFPEEGFSHSPTQIPFIHVGFHRLLSLGLLIVACSALIVGFSHSIAMIACFRLTTGLGLAAVGPIAQSLISDLVDPVKRGKGNKKGERKNIITSDIERSGHLPHMLVG